MQIYGNNYELIKPPINTKIEEIENFPIFLTNLMWSASWLNDYSQVELDNEISCITFLISDLE